MKKYLKKIKNFLLKAYNKRKLYNATICEQNDVALYLRQNYVNLYMSNEIPKVNLKPKKELGTDKIIWQYWGQGVNESTPKIVKMCFESVNKYKGEYKQIILTNETIKDYIDIPDFVYEKLENNQEFTLTFFSDLLRVYLLSAYGGVWIDATVMLTDKIREDWLKKDFFVFQRTEKPKDYKIWEQYNSSYFGWNKKWKVNLLSSFIIAKPRNIIIEALKDILTEYWRKENSLRHYFLMHLIFDELLNFDIYKNVNCEKVSDLLPHLIQLNAGKEYSKKLLGEIKSSCEIHKLTYFKYLTAGTLIELLLYNFQKQWEINPIRGTENITFCSMLFNIGNKKISNIKGADRDFENFYLTSLKKLAQNYRNLVLWCDNETYEYIKNNKLDYIKTYVINFKNLPYYKKRSKYLNILNTMYQEYSDGYLLKYKTPESIVDYLILTLCKIDIIKWAKDMNFYNTDYFYWIDAGTNNQIYYRCWYNFDGLIEAKTKCFKCSLMTKNASINDLDFRQISYKEIAYITAPFEIPMAMFLVHHDIIDKFYLKYEETIEFLENENLITYEQGVISTMLKRGYMNLFEVSFTQDYNDVMNLVAKNDNIHL